MNDKQEFVDITETVYRGARKGRGLVVSPKGENAIFQAAGVLSPLSLARGSPDGLVMCRLFHQVQVLMQRWLLGQRWLLVGKQ